MLPKGQRLADDFIAFLVQSLWGDEAALLDKVSERLLEAVLPMIKKGPDVASKVMTLFMGLMAKSRKFEDVG